MGALGRGRAVALALLLGLAPAGCDGCRASEATVPDGLKVDVVVAGKTMPPIDAARLRATRADFRDGPRRAWRLDKLVGPAYHPAMRVRVEDAEGRVVVLDPPRSGGATIPVVEVNRTGGVRVGRADPREPFPRFHGRGGHRGRSGDARRARSAVRILLDAAKPGEHDDLVLDLGAESMRVSVDDLGDVPSVAFPAGDGEGTRAAWSLRDLVRKRVGARARVVAVRGEGERRVAVDLDAWNDPERIPLLRKNRRGLLRFAWVGRDLIRLDDAPGLRGVRVIEVSP